ncbi:MAG: endonuclease/exonuclease/phosphatase family protein [Bacteroides cellulosilyticus]|nr:endonuclease/exonuclease/phosphatase family protein [Bacteroides cellulosilyticus]
MNEELYSDISGRPGRRSSWAVRIADLLLSVVSLGMAVAMTVVFFVPYVDPARMWFLPLLGLAAPALYVATVVLALYWIVRWRWGRAGVMLAFVVAGLFWAPRFWKPRFGRSYKTPTYSKAAVKVLSYNVRYLQDAEGADCADAVLRLIDSLDADIVCLQEFSRQAAERSGHYEAFAAKYAFARFGLDEEADPTQAVFSKQRIVGSGVVLTPQSAVWADLRVGDDTVRVYNNHLQSTAIKAADNDYITNRDFIADADRERKFRSMARRLRANGLRRAAQVDSIAAEIAARAPRRIVCGDFNDTPMSYVYRTMSRGLVDAFACCGEGYSHTYRGFFDMLRIDFVFASPDLELLSYEVPEVGWSDHFPVLVRVRTVEQQN